MDWIDIKGLQDEEQQIIETYNKINEETRLNLSNSSSIEFLTNTKYVENMLENKSSILELGAGTGVYSIYFANKGFDVTAVELSKRNVSIFKSKIPDTISVDVITGNALKMDYLCDRYFDAVLSFGPLYHISSFKDRINCLKESLRVLKDDGYIFITLINNDMVPMVEMQYQSNYFTSSCFDHETFKMENFPYIFHTLDEARSLINASGIKIIKEIASDGLSRICAKEIDQLDRKNFEEYKKFHFYMCENPSFLSATSHFLFVGEKSR